MEGLTGKRVLVTGGSRGIGAETVRAFVRAGARVAFTFAASEKEAAALSDECGAVAVRADSRREEEVISAVGAATAALGGSVEILVNNAGICYTGLLSEMPLASWNDVMAVNAGGVFLFSRAVIPGMVHAKSGRIINISSVWGLVGGSCEVAYSTSKAAVIGFTKGLAKELGPSGITVNAVAPGVIDTRMIGELDGEARGAICEETPLGRLGTPADVAAAILFLAGQGGDFMTGQVLSPNGGFTVV